MFQACRPTGRLFYLALTVIVIATSSALVWAREEAPAGKPATSPTAKPGAATTPRAASPAPQSGPALTTIADNVYLADGTPAQGVLIIFWPAFVTAGGTPVAAGTTNVTLGSSGALSVALAANAGANPPGIYYTVVYQLGPGEVKTEYWLVPTSSPATLAQVRTTPGSGTAVPAASVEYVNTVAATKANDNAVVHLTGAETVTGAKTFTTSPNVPTPVGTGDVTNKSYVDAAIATVGAGNFLPTAGGAMTGALTLNGNPTAPLQATPKQYVDTATAAKADLVTGLVPTSELGSGAASALNCLLGNGTWGSCGSSANATEIQSVPVGSTAPANGQVLTYSSSSGQYAPATPSGGAGGVLVSPAASQNIAQPAGTQFSVNNISGIRYVTPGDNWSQNPSGSVTAGANTVTLVPCPRGLTANNPGVAQTYVYLSGVGTPEAVLITSTTCTQGGGANGAITFTAVNSHGTGYAVGSASQGVQEAINAAALVPNFSGGIVELGSVVIPPGPYMWQARVTVPGAGMELDFSGSIVTCTMADTCLFVGSTAHPTNVWDVTIKNFTGQAGCNNCNFPMIEDDAQKTRLIAIGTANPFPAGSATSGSSFGSLIQVDSDQAAIIDGLSAYQARWYHCTTTFCSVAVKGAGGSGNSGVLWIKNSNMNLSCAANGVDNQNSNTLRISDSVIQSQAQFGVRATSTYSNVPSVELDNVYFEVAGCANTNPLGIGIAGLIVEGGFASVKDSVGPTGAAQLFANTGSTQYNYYIVAHSSSNGGMTSAPFLAGIGLTNGAGSIPVAWPQFGTTGTVTYDVIRTSGLANTPAPYTAICAGGSTTACGSVATGLTVGSSCSAVGSTNICTFTDTASASTSTYTVTSPPSYWPALTFWNGAVVYTTPGDAVGISPSPSGVHFDRFGDNVTNSAANPVNQVVSSFGNMIPKFFAQQCVNTNGGAWLSCGETATGTTAGAMLLQAGAYNAPDNPGLKGRLILEQGLYGNIAGGHKITLVDSNPAKTLATGGMRPVYDLNDTYVGLDNPATTAASNAQLAFGAPVSISHYIGNAGDNTSFLERLTASAKTFNVPVNVNGTVTVNGQLLVAGPWMVSSPIPGTAMAAAGAGTSALGISNDGNFYISANAGTPQRVATIATSSFFSNLFQEDANNLGEYNGTTPQGLNIYGTRTDASDYERLALTYDTVNTSYFKLDAQSAGTGTHRGIAFWVNGAGRWGIDQLNILKPFVDNSYDLGSSALRVRNGYFGTGVIAPSLTLNGSALSSVIGTPSANLMTAGTVSGTGAPLCTDGTGNLTITTVGCPPGTGTLGGSGTTPQFAYWSNTNGLAAAPVFLTSANTVEQYNSTNVQTFNVYGTRTDASNYERASLTYVAADTFYELQTQQAGTGGQHGFCFGVNNSCKWAVDTNTAFKPFNDNVRDIGTSSLRVRDFYLGRNLIMSGTATTYNGKTTAGTGLAPIYGAVSLTGQTAAISSSTLCASSTCGSGQYIANYYLDSTVSCTTAGSAAASLTIGWTDETGAKTFQVPLSGTGVSGGNSLSLGNTTNFASGDISLWSAGSANVTYSASYTGCTSGTGTYALRITLRQLQ